MISEVHPLLGWHAHGTVGFDHERARAIHSVPEGFALEAAFALGRKGDVSQLAQAMQSREKPAIVSHSITSRLKDTCEIDQ
jgi:hypothetical protein